MPNIEQQETSPGLTGEELLSASLALEEQLAQRDLYSTLRQSDIPVDIAKVYEKLGAELTPSEEEKSYTFKRLGRGIKRELWDSTLGRSIAGTVVITTIGEIINQGGPIEASKVFVAFYNKLVGWAGETITKPEAWPMISAAGVAILWTLFSPKIYEIISSRDSAKTVKTLSQDAQAREKRTTALLLHQEGNADLFGIGPNIQIDVGKSDPSALLLIDLFHRLGIEVVTYWDQRNIHFAQNKYWEKTYNDWTNRESLLRGNVQESLCSIILVSNGDDVFLSSRIQDPTREAQDMTDNEAIGSINARNSVRNNLGLPATPHIMVTNPQRLIDIGVVKSGSESFHPKTVGQVIREKYPNVHIIDPDLLIIEELAQLAFQEKSKKNLPLELITNSVRASEYKTNLRQVINEYNQKIGNDKTENIRFSRKKDGLETLSIIYGSTDEDTIAQLETYKDDFSQEGELVAIINDPEKVARLPEGSKYICVGTVIAKAIFKKFIDLVVQGAIELPQQIALPPEPVQDQELAD